MTRLPCEGTLSPQQLYLPTSTDVLVLCLNIPIINSYVVNSSQSKKTQGVWRRHTDPFITNHMKA